MILAGEPHTGKSHMLQTWESDAPPATPSPIPLSLRVPAPTPNEPEAGADFEEISEVRSYLRLDVINMRMRARNEELLKKADVAIICVDVGRKGSLDAVLNRVSGRNSGELSRTSNLERLLALLVVNINLRSLLLLTVDRRRNPTATSKTPHYPRSHTHRWQPFPILSLNGRTCPACCPLYSCLANLHRTQPRVSRPNRSHFRVRGLRREEPEAGHAGSNTGTGVARWACRSRASRTRGIGVWDVPSWAGSRDRRTPCLCPCLL